MHIVNWQYFITSLVESANAYIHVIYDLSWKWNPIFPIKKNGGGGGIVTRILILRVLLSNEI